MKKLILFLMLIPITASAGSLYLTPGHFEPAEPLNSGRPYFINFNVSNRSEENITIITSFECFPSEERECPPADWFKASKKLKIKAGESEPIKVRVKIPKNQPNGLYQIVLMVSPISEDSEGTTRLALSLGGIIKFEKSGNLNWFFSLYYFFQERWGNRLKASLENIGIGTNVILIVFGLVGAGLIGEKTYKHLTTAAVVRK